ncbi:pirin family protein [Viridibacterium curvum]|uniref:Pirin family protein n=1 Tax=Viridibacterium curvum TaxID=1101404 RepID=A0ABP9Q786_9RHOO
MSAARPLLLHPQSRDIGFTVRRLLPAVQARSIGPFVFLDHMGPARFKAGSTENDVRPHPHIGLGTLTYLFSGAIMHRDSLGIVQRIEPGAVNWMCAGRGVVHSERFPEDLRSSDTTVEGIQMWLALPADKQEVEPSFQHYPADVLPRWQDAGAHWHLLIGHWGERSSPVTQLSDTFYVAGELATGDRFSFPAHVIERALYVVSGALKLGEDSAGEGTLVVLPADWQGDITATADSRVMLLGGAPLDGPRHMWWNFVSTSRERIAQAYEDWEAGRFPVVPGETEYIPAPPLKPAT